MNIGDQITPAAKLLPTLAKALPKKGLWGDRRNLETQERRISFPINTLKGESVNPEEVEAILNADDAQLWEKVFSTLSIKYITKLVEQLPGLKDFVESLPFGELLDSDSRLAYAFDSTNQPQKLLVDTFRSIAKAAIRKAAQDYDRELAEQKLDHQKKDIRNYGIAISVPQYINFQAFRKDLANKMLIEPERGSFRAYCSNQFLSANWSLIHLAGSSPQEVTIKIQFGKEVPRILYMLLDKDSRSLVPNLEKTKAAISEEFEEELAGRRQITKSPYYYDIEEILYNYDGIGIPAINKVRAMIEEFRTTKKLTIFEKAESLKNEATISIAELFNLDPNKLKEYVSQEYKDLEQIAKNTDLNSLEAHLPIELFARAVYNAMREQVQNRLANDPKSKSKAA